MLSKKIVLATDDELQEALENSFFQRAGFELLPATDVQAALALIEEWGPDLAILDGEAPGAESLCRRLKSDTLLRSTRLLLVVSAAADNAAARCRAAGCDALLFRPLEESVLQAVACRLLGILCRAEARMPVDLPLRYRAGAADLGCGRVLNLTRGGLFVACDRYYPVGTLLALDLVPPGMPAALAISGRVAWVNHPEWIKIPSLPPGMGLRFVDISEEARRGLGEILKRVP